MIKISKQKILLTITILTILLISNTYVSLGSTAKAAVIANEQKGLSIANDVIGIDLSKYNVTTEESPQSGNNSFRGAVQDNIVCNLKSDTSQLKIGYTFANGQLQMMQVLQNVGVLTMTNSAATKTNTTIKAVDLARSFLNNYEVYSSNSLFGQLASTLDKIRLAPNITETFGNIVVQVTYYNNSHTNFRWYYICNGAIAPYSKFVALELKDGFVAGFIDNWDLYNVCNTNIKLSKEDAVNIALQTAKAYNWTTQLEPDSLKMSNLNESNVVWNSLVFDNSQNASIIRSNNALDLYPVWRVGISFGKWYGPLYGVEVDVWADTGQVRSMQVACSNLAPGDIPNADLNSQPTKLSDNTVNSAFFMLLFPMLIIFAMGVAILWVSKRSQNNCFTILRRHGIKAGGVMICVLMLSTIFIGALSTVNATSRGAVVWGSESNGALPNFPPDPENHLSWRKTDFEISAQEGLAGVIYSDFADDNWNSYNNQGYGQGEGNSTKISILSTLDSLQAANDYVAIVDFDHGIFSSNTSETPLGEIHYMFEDTIGTYVGYHINYTVDPTHGVYDMDIYNHTINYGQKVVFVFASTCMSANLTYGQGLVNGVNARTFPLAWMHHQVGYQGSELSPDGYNYPDDSQACFIGFTSGSPSLSQNLPFEVGSITYAMWVSDFFYAAIFPDYSVNQALNYASMENWGYWFGDSNCPLQDFNASWPGVGEGYNCQMVVYGDGNMFLKDYNPSVDTVGPPTVYGPGYYVQPYPESYTFAATAWDSQGKNLKYLFDWGDGTYTWVDSNNYYPSGNEVFTSHSWDTPGQYTVTVNAINQDGVWNVYPTLYGVDVMGGTYYTLTAEADAYDQAYNYMGPADVPVHIDYQLAGYTPLSTSVQAGVHFIELYSAFYGYGNGYFEANGMWYFDGNNWYQTYETYADIPIYQDTYIYVSYILVNG
jgi:hypothetical protein